MMLLSGKPTFSLPLKQSLISSRSRWIEWAKLQTEQADVAAETYRQECNAQQSEIDGQMAYLLALQLKRSLTVHENEEQQQPSGGETKEDVEETIALIQQEMQTSTEQRATKEAQMQGTLVLERLKGIKQLVTELSPLFSNI
jgi:hypothetical protein